MTEPADVDHDPDVTSRRRFLREGGALMGGAVLAGGLSGREAMAASENADNVLPNIPQWMKTPGDLMGSQADGTPLPFEKGVVKNASGRTPLVRRTPSPPVSLHAVEAKKT